MSETGLIELMRRIGALGLAVLGLAGGLTVFSPLTGLVCLAAAVGLYVGLPSQKPPTGAVQPEWQPTILMSDCIGFLVGVPFFALPLVAAAYVPSAVAGWTMLLFLPAAFCFPIFYVSARQATSWARFFGNGFEVTDFGLTMRLRYTELARAEIRIWQLPRGLSLFAPFLDRRHGVTLVAGSAPSKALRLTSKTGAVFVIATEAIPDLERIFVDMDRAGIELPKGLSDLGRRRIRRVREKRWGKVEPEPTPARKDQGRFGRTL
ncbi:hypothetical protein [Pannonibacter tanglangensis]|uniref:PH domain-containing protein n=1 Tax=Pannonibacter tanglangensis TaxID=2750084 RepID=A0ABW9ZM12_9HYPH|nr:hypothetical protein [Pannonibacter sp. XCT-34]NBN65915.1 hypothetical protein [Pannonibacter sp. XCT-34]